MSPFFFVAALMCLLAVVLLVLPLRRTQSPASVDRAGLNVKFFKERLKELDAEKERGLIDGQQFALAVAELEKGLLTDLSSNEASTDPLHHQAYDSKRNSKPYIVALTALALPLISFIIYFQIGHFEEEKTWNQLKDEINPAILGLERGQDNQAELANYSLQEVVAVLQARLQQEGGSPQAWLLLGLLYSQANKVEVAVTAFEKAMTLAPDNPEIKIAYAETLMKQDGGRLNRSSFNLLQDVLKITPDNPRASSLLAMGSYNSGLYQQAIDIWQRLLIQEGEKSEKAPLLKNSIAMARQAMSGKAPPSPDSSSDTLAASETRLRQLVMQEGVLTDEIEKLLSYIFSIDPENQRALAFQGMLSFNSGQYQRAINTWEQLLKYRAPGSEGRKLIESSIQKAKAKLSETR